MIQWLEARVWQVGTFAAGAAALSLAVALGVTTLQKNALSRDVTKLEGTVATQAADLTTCRNNRKVLDKAIVDSNAEVQRLSDESVARTAAARSAVAAAQRENVALQRRLDRLAATPISGSTACERMEDADRRVLEILR